MGLEASKRGLDKIREAIEARNWKMVNDRRFLEAASRILEPEEDWDKKWTEEPDRYARGISQKTLARFIYATDPIRPNTFQAFCKVLGLEWKDIIDCPASPPVLPSSGSPQKKGGLDLVPLEPSLHFYGRKSELKELQQWLSLRCHLIVIYGLGGIGKTALAVKLWEEERFRKQFSEVIWQPLLYTYSLEELLTDLLYRLSPGSVRSSNNQEALLTNLLRELQRQQVLIVLDEQVTVVTDSQRDQYQVGCKQYLALFQRFAASSSHQSSIVLATREKPADVTAVGDSSVKVKALREIDNESACKILENKGLTVNQNQSEDLIKRYGGNPLALKLSASIIQNYFCGDVNAFLRASVILPPSIESMLEQQMSHLNAVEILVLKKLAASDEAMQQEDFKDGGLSTSKIIKTISALERQSLLEKVSKGSQVLYALPSMIRKFVQDNLM